MTISKAEKKRVLRTLKPRKRGMPRFGRIVFSVQRLASLPPVANATRTARFLGVSHKTVLHWVYVLQADILFGDFVRHGAYRKIKIDKHKLITWLCATGRASLKACDVLKGE